MTETFKLFKCPCCGTITKKIEKVSFTKDIIYEMVRLTVSDIETIESRDTDSINCSATTFYRCKECGLETGDLSAFDTKHTYRHDPQPEESTDKKYLVTWTMHYNAEDAMDAALQALSTIQDPENTATVFEITDENGITTAIDALEKQIINTYTKE